jgi:hypothetical protein
MPHTKAEGSSPTADGKRRGKGASRYTVALAPNPSPIKSRGTLETSTQA